MSKKEKEILQDPIKRKLSDKDFNLDSHFQYLFNGKAESLRKLFGIEQDASKTKFISDQQFSHLTNSKPLVLNSERSREQLNKNLYKNPFSNNVYSHTEITKFPTIKQEKLFLCKQPRNHSKFSPKIGCLPSLKNKHVKSTYHQDSDLLSGW